VEFDQKVGRDRSGGIFGRLHGNRGLASADRATTHLVNGYESEFSVDGGPVFRGLRHGICADRYETDETLRKETARSKASELLTAAIIQELEERKITPEQAASQKQPLELVFSSESLVTPDPFRRLSERAALRDQIEALKFFDGEKVFEIGGHRVKVNLTILTFNHGVNAGAIGRYKGRPIPKMGLKEQHRYNKESFKSLDKVVENFLKATENFRGSEEQREEWERLSQDVASLRKDIGILSRKKDSYLEGGNQYELGAKILLLMNVMNRARQLAQQQKLDIQIPGYKCAFNCWSGKDRTGVMESMVKALTMMRKVNGFFPSIHDLRDNDILRKQLLVYLIHILMQGGGLDITEINSDGRGYKVQGEAKIWPWLWEEIAAACHYSYEDVVGVSDTVYV